MPCMPNASARSLASHEVAAPGIRIPLSGTLSGYNLSLTADINPTGDSYPYDLVEVNGKIYFGAAQSEGDYELWVYDPALGTVDLAADIWPGPQSSDPYALIAIGDKLYFAADAPGLGYELWSYDTGGRILSSPAVCNIDQDTELEVIVGSDDGKVSCHQTCQR